MPKFYAKMEPKSPPKWSHLNFNGGFGDPIQIERIRYDRKKAWIIVEAFLAIFPRVKFHEKHDGDDVD